MTFPGATNVEVTVEQLLDEAVTDQNNANPHLYYGPNGNALSVTIALEKGPAMVFYKNIVGNC